MEEEYAQSASPVSTLRAILEGYPLSAGIFRELLANSDDAGASKQIFVLDQRNHSTEGLFSEGLASSQGPAFLAFNDAILRAQDWKALSSIHDSSKVADELKIGKFGVGFRTTFNVTDSPQILSDNHLAIFDPLRLHLKSEGKKIPLGSILSTCPNQLLPFGFFMKDGPVSPFPGTVIRCPLRSAPSAISDQVVPSQTISSLFKEFMDQELDISCLFLTNIKTIEIYEVTSTGTHSLLAKMTISRADPVQSTTFQATVELDRNQISERKMWQIVQKSFSRDEAVKILSQQPGYNPSTVARTLQCAKFSPEIKIAVDVTSTIRGRLFTYLPLTTLTGFPVHVHALFGIDTSRAHLRHTSVGLMSGSQDHMKVQWNKMLFQTFIPRTWGFMLEEMVSRGLVSDVFNIWPPERCSGEVEPYCVPLSSQLADALLAAKATVWPVYQSTEFRSLDALVVASPAERLCLLQALASIGLPLTQPPQYIFELLRKPSRNVSILNPEVAHRLLLEKVDEVTRASGSDKELLLEYLLSSRNVLNICDLHLVPVTNGEKVTITQAPGVPVYTILTRSEFDIFGLCDDLAIPSHQLSPHAASTLLELEPRFVNVQRLTVQCIVKYLSIYSNHLNSQLSEGKMNLSAVLWLSRFWEWIDTYEHKDELFPQIRSFPLLPSSKGLRTVDSTLFKLRGEHYTYTMGYLALGVPFLSMQVSDAAHGVLQRYRLVNSISDIPALLDAIASVDPAQLSQPDCENILKHLASKLDGPTKPDTIYRVRNIPVFPLLAFTMNGNSSSVVTTWTAIPRGHSIRSVSRTRFVPLVEGVSFVRLDNIAPTLIKVLEQSHPNPMSENELIELAVENFTTQPGHLQLALLQHIANNRTRIIQDVINKLGGQAFVLAEDGAYHVPGDIVDPDSDIGKLYIGCSAHLPSRSGPCAEIMPCLKSLGLLRGQLNPEIVAERVEFISSRYTSDEALLIARNLLLLLASSNLDCSLVQGISEKKWLPTNRGLCSADECRHAVLTPLALFDQVLAILEPSTILPSLQTALRWDAPLRIDLLFKQLDCLLNSEHGYDAVVDIVRELGQRQWSDDQCIILERIVGDRLWIPTTGNTLADIKSSVFKFSPTMLNSGFHQIRTDLKAENLLRRMGCTDHPSTRAILDKLRSLNQNRDSNHIDPVGTAVSLLRSVPDDITIAEREELLIPDKESLLRPFSETFYNDIGENYLLVNTDGHFIAHHSLDESLVMKLGLHRLGLRYAEFRNVGPNMGQAPITTVRRTLQQYTNKQFLLEFLANAEDATATEFTVAINHTTVREEQNLSVLSPAMVYLCRLPSLVVYNNGHFTLQDFEGICNTSVGGKEDRPATIGEFGLGVLTMYHFTDLAMVISGSRVLFLDPSKKHLPLPDRAALILELRCVQQFYKDHLVALDGLFNFNMVSPSYDGTLFVLPLRALDGTNHPIIPDFWSPERIVSEILEPFRNFASDCLLFTGIQTISCITRAAGGVVMQNWLFRAIKTVNTDVEAGYVVTDVEIIKSPDSTAHWKTVRMSCSKDQLPSEFQVEPSLTRKPSFAGLAARLDRASDGISFNFFSILPLSSPTTLPMHVMASFKLSSDRRQIRLDIYEELQTKYNTWLLEQLIPPLYLFFLEHLLNSDDVHYRLRWPSEKGRGNNLSNHIIDSFYSAKHLKVSTRHIFPSLYSPLRILPPQEAFLHSDSIRLILDRLKPYQVVDLPSGPRELAERAGLRTVDPGFIKSEIMRTPEAITSGDNFEMILDIILHLARQADSTEILNGLPILPLEDGTFGTLNSGGTGKPYYLWRPTKDQTCLHNFDEQYFVHPKMKCKELEKFKLNVLPLSAPSIKGLIEAKLSTFSGSGTSQAQLQWTDSFWRSWEEYASLGLSHRHIESFPLVPTPSALVTLEQCKKGDIILLQGDSHEVHDLHDCLRKLSLPVVHVANDGQIPHALQEILKTQDTFPPFKLRNVLPAISRAGPLSELFRALDDGPRRVFAEWAKKNITDIPDDQIALVRDIPIWWSDGGGAPPSFRPASEVYLLPEHLTLRDAAPFMAGYVAEDTSLTNLGMKQMTPDQLLQQLLLPVLNATTLLDYKQLYKKCSSDYRQPLPVPTSADTFRCAQELFKREPLFTAVFHEDPSFFIHSEFEEFEGLGMQSEECLDMRTFKTCAQRLDVNDPTAVARAREVFRAFREILPNRVTKQPHAWRELDDIPFIPRRMNMVREISNLNEPGLEIPPEVMRLDAIVQPVELVKEEFEAIAWSQRACFEIQPDPGVYVEYPSLGTPSPSEVIAHLRYLSHLTSLCTSQHRILLHDVKKVYKYLDSDLFKENENEELTQAILLTLRDEPLFLNIDGDEERLNWVKGSALAFDCHQREGSMQGVRAFLRPFEETLVAAGALKVYHPSFTREHDNRPPEYGISSIFDQLRRDKALTDVMFIFEPTENDPDPEPLFAHRTFLAVSSGYLRDMFCSDSQESRHASLGYPFKLEVHYSRQCVRSFLDHIYTGSKGGRDSSLELLLELLDVSNTYRVMDLFDGIQGEIIERRLLTPETMDKIQGVAEKQKAKLLLEACTQYESANTEFIRKSRVVAQICDI